MSCSTQALSPGFPISGRAGHKTQPDHAHLRARFRRPVPSITQTRTGPASPGSGVLLGPFLPTLSLPSAGSGTFPRGCFWAARSGPGSRDSLLSSTGSHSRGDDTPGTGLPSRGTASFPHPLAPFPGHCVWAAEPGTSSTCCSKAVQTAGGETRVSSLGLQDLGLQDLGRVYVPRAYREAG